VLLVFQLLFGGSDLGDGADFFTARSGEESQGFFGLSLSSLEPDLLSDALLKVTARFGGAEFTFFMGFSARLGVFAGSFELEAFDFQPKFALFRFTGEGFEIGFEGAKGRLANMDFDFLNFEGDDVCPLSFFSFFGASEFTGADVFFEISDAFPGSFERKVFVFQPNLDVLFCAGAVFGVVFETALMGGADLLTKKDFDFCFFSIVCIGEGEFGADFKGAFLRKTDFAFCFWGFVGDGGRFFTGGVERVIRKDCAFFCGTTLGFGGEEGKIFLAAGDVLERFMEVVFFGVSTFDDDEELCQFTPVEGLTSKPNCFKTSTVYPASSKSGNMYSIFRPSRVARKSSAIFPFFR